MLTLYAAPNTRAVRVLWLLEELNLGYALERVEFRNTSTEFFIQNTPTGKIPTLVDGNAVLSESGAIVEYLLERYDTHTLSPAPRSTDRASYLQWLHFSESTAFAPIGVVVWLTVYRQDAAEHPKLVADAIARAQKTLQYLEQQLTGSYLTGSRFSAADIMMGFTLGAAKRLMLLEDLPRLNDYVDRLSQRPAYTRSLKLLS